MSDWKSLYVILVADDAVPAFAGGEVMPALSPLLDAAHQEGRMRNFPTVSFDYLVWLEALLEVYDTPRLARFQAVTEGEDGTVYHTRAAQCGPLAQALAGWQARFASDPGPAAALAQRASHEMQAHLAEAAAQVPSEEWLADKLREAEAQAARQPAITGAEMAALWAANEGKGYFPDAYPAPLAKHMRDWPSSPLAAFFQSFGYIKAMQNWARAAGAQRVGLVELGW